ncbi:hypothetical protein Tco_0345338 [Tanacetum coccineum]
MVTDFPSRNSQFLGFSLRNEPVSKGTVHHQRLPSSLKKFRKTSSRKEMKHYTKLGNDYAGPRKVPQVHDRWLSSELSSKNIESSSNSEGIAAIVNKLENLGRDMKKLKENVHAIQVGCQNFRGAHLDKDCPLKEEVKSMKEAKYGEFGRPSLFQVIELSIV